MATFINMYFNRLLKFPKIESASKPDSGVTPFTQKRK